MRRQKCHDVEPALSSNDELVLAVEVPCAHITAHQHVVLIDTLSIILTTRTSTPSTNIRRENTLASIECSTDAPEALMLLHGLDVEAEKAASLQHEIDG